MAGSRNVSFTLNRLPAWDNQLLAGIGGSAASLGMYDPIDVAIPVINQSPGAFNANFLLNEDTTIKDRIAEILGPAITGGPAGIIAGAAGAASGSLPDWIDPHIPSWTEIEEKSKTAGKYILLALIALILLMFGLWILLAPTLKPIAKETLHAAATGA